MSENFIRQYRHWFGARIAFSVITVTVCVSMYYRYATRTGIALTGKGNSHGKEYEDRIHL